MALKRASAGKSRGRPKRSKICTILLVIFKAYQHESFFAEARTFLGKSGAISSGQPGSRIF